MTIKHIGLIGVGLMGHGIGKNLLEKGYQLTVMAHRNREPVDSLVAKGAKELNNPHDIAKACDMIVMATHGRGTFGELLFGSQTKNVMARSKLPLVVLH